jgi:hypothetical protein
MSRIHTTILAALAALFVNTGAHADIILGATLTNGAENPPVGTASNPLLTSTGAPRPTSFGTATFVLNNALTAMTMTATITNIDVTGSQTADPNDNLSAAHIHAGAGVSPTINAGVVWGFFGIPDNDINPDNLVITPSAGVGGTFTSVWNQAEGNPNGMNTLTAQLPFILSQRSYINFHTMQFGGGEIRGTLIVLAAPEPSTVALLGLAALGLIGFGWRRPAVRS